MDKKSNGDSQLWEVAKNVSIDHRVVVIIVLLILLLITLTFKFSGSEKFMRANDIFSKGFAVINFVLIIYVIYINIQYNANNDERANREQSYKMSKYLWSDTIDNMVKYFPETYIFYNQLEQFDTRTEEEILAELKPNESKTKLLNCYFSNIIVQNLEDFLTLKKYLTTIDHLSWVVTFYQMFQSKILQENWKEVKTTFAPNTSNVIQQFVDIGIKAEKEKLSEGQVAELLKKIDFTS
jgi:hypothetical protein